MSNKRAFVLGIAAVFGAYVTLGVLAELVENRVIRHLHNDGIVVGVGVITNGNKNINANKHKDAKEAGKEES